MADEGVGRCERGGGECERGGGECERGVCAWSIIRNSFGYIAISIVLNYKASYCVIAEKWLKRNYNTSGILCGVECAIVERVEDREIGFFTIGQGCVGVAVRRFYIFTRLYLIDKKAQGFLLCHSRKVAKTE